MSRQIVLALIGCFALPSLGCPGREVSKVDPDPEVEGRKDIPVEINRDVDILFVIDNSLSMKEEQESLVRNFNNFINVLQGIEGGLPNVHIGVVSTDVGVGPFDARPCTANGDDGRLQNSAQVPGCPTPTDPFIKDLGTENGSRIQNFTGDLADVFSCIAELGDTGCGFEQPLESMRRALNANPFNVDSEGKSFLRKDAFLAVIIISDEDDCSTTENQIFDSQDNGLGPQTSFRCFDYGVYCGDPDTPRAPGPRENCIPRPGTMSSESYRSPYMTDVSEYVEFLRGLKEDPSLVIVAGIIGNATPVVVGSDEDTNPRLEPSCTSGSGEAAPAVRTQAFLDSFPQRSTTTTICNEDLSDALIIIANLLALVIGNPCIEGDIDRDKAMDGIQYDCQVSDIRFPGGDNQQESVLPQCSSATPDASEHPCWHFVEDRETCPDTLTGFTLMVERGSTTVPPGTNTRVRCSLDNG